MPQGDRTGPMGQGSRTGRALGFCSGYDSPGYTKGFGGGFGRGIGRGMGRGRGMSMCFGRGGGFGWTSDIPYSQPLSKKDEIRFLKSQAESLKRSQQDIEQRLNELEKEKE